MVSFIILLGATLIIFIIFEQVLMPQLNCQSLLFSKKGKNRKEKNARKGFSQNGHRLLPCSDRATIELAPVVATAPALAPCRPSPGGQEDPHDALPAPLSFLSPFLPFSRIEAHPRFLCMPSIVSPPLPLIRRTWSSPGQTDEIGRAHV